MGLFAKKCSVCGRKLPEKRHFKGVCDPCGMDYHRIKKQLEETIDLVERTKNPATGYDRCILGLELSDQFAPFVKANLAKFPRGTTLSDQKNFFLDISNNFLYDIRQKNEKKKYSKKVGLPNLIDYKRLSRITNSQIKPGSCKACYKPGEELNEAGYCRECLMRATVITFSDFENMVIEGLLPNTTAEAAWSAMQAEGNNAVVRYINLKLDRLSQLEKKQVSQTSAVKERGAG